ncbi:MAG: ribonuclease HII [Alicyclobacillus sp. RIFOXYA1_FULL_53_8]|nr:MAG: ribonuclease HII [Alicyclobacillus sp. RIFOXYA1_FULL_53_8]
MWNYERSVVGDLSPGLVAGVDEAGRGALAGPVYAAAVVLGGVPDDWQGIKDSKLISRKKRELLYDLIRSRALAVGVGVANLEEIDRLNILHASRTAMGRAIHNLPVAAGFVLVDGTYLPLYPSGFSSPGLAIVDGDAKCISIAAASIVAKVERDRHMEELGHLYPHYGFDRHVGYGTSQHLAMLRQYGPSPCHRNTFGPVKESEQLRLGVL